MKCPVCDVDLAMAERQGIEIDYCPTCRGVWLDRGELDKIIERAAGESGPPPGSGRDSEPRRDEGRERERDDRGEERSYDDRHEAKQYDSHKSRKKKKPSSFLGDIFEGLGG